MEMTPAECLARISQLLELYPGVRVVSATRHDLSRTSYLTLSITSLESLLRIVHLCYAGPNIAVHISTAGAPLPKGQPLDVSRYRYDLRLPDENGGSSFTNPPAPLQALGIYLARDLKYLHLLSPGEADALQVDWHGGVM